MSIRNTEAAALRGWVEMLAVPRHFFANPTANAWVRAQLVREFSRLGYAVTVQGESKNVVALPPGVGPLTLIAAHYDSVPNCPGADAAAAF